MRIGSILFSNTGSFFVVLGQEGTGLKTYDLFKNLHYAGEPFVEKVILQPGDFHRLREGGVEQVLQTAHNLPNTVPGFGQSLPNPNPKPAYHAMVGEEDDSGVEEEVEEDEEELLDEDEDE